MVASEGAILAEPLGAKARVLDGGSGHQAAGESHRMPRSAREGNLV